MRDKRLDNRPTDATELILIRIGHHLWRSYKRKEWEETAISNALEAVWALKESIRIPLRAKWLESYGNRVKQASERMAEYHKSKRMENSND